MRKFTRLSMLLALAVVLNIVETMVPFFSGYIPGLKLGLANTIVLLVLYVYSFKEALYISFLRVLLVSILRTGLFSIAFWFSLSGSILSIFMMLLFKKTKLFSIIGVSIIGSIFHSIGQIIVAMLLIDTTSIMYYLPLLLIFSVPTGIMVGLISKQLVNRYEKELKNL